MPIAWGAPATSAYPGPPSRPRVAGGLGYAGKATPLKPIWICPGPGMATLRRERNGPVTLKIGDTAPDFEAETTEGPIKFHDWIGDSWAALFSHPKDFTPICTTELGYMAKIKPEFDRRGVKITGLSVDRIDSQGKWLDDTDET